METLLEIARAIAGRRGPGGPGRQDEHRLLLPLGHTGLVLRDPLLDVWWK
jgi:hypothetical protein